MSPSVAAVAKARAVLFIAFPPCLSAQAINVGSGVSRITHDDFKCTTGAIGSVRAKAGGPAPPLIKKPAGVNRRADGEEAGKQIIRWIALLGAMTDLLDAVRGWLQVFPH